MLNLRMPDENFSIFNPIQDGGWWGKGGVEKRPPLPVFPL